eukprot:6269924-Amphidinium_carterae.1
MSMFAPLIAKAPYYLVGKLAVSRLLVHHFSDAAAADASKPFVPRINSMLRATTPDNIPVRYCTLMVVHHQFTEFRQCAVALFAPSRPLVDQYQKKLPIYFHRIRTKVQVTPGSDKTAWASQKCHKTLDYNWSQAGGGVGRRTTGRWAMSCQMLSTAALEDGGSIRTTSTSPDVCRYQKNSYVQITLIFSHIDTSGDGIEFRKDGTRTEELGHRGREEIAERLGSAAKGIATGCCLDRNVSSKTSSIAKKVRTGYSRGAPATECTAAASPQLESKWLEARHNGSSRSDTDWSGAVEGCQFKIIVIRNTLLSLTQIMHSTRPLIVRPSESARELTQTTPKTIVRLETVL